MATKCLDTAGSPEYIRILMNEIILQLFLQSSDAGFYVFPTPNVRRHGVFYSLDSLILPLPEENSNPPYVSDILIERRVRRAGRSIRFLIKGNGPLEFLSRRPFVLSMNVLAGLCLFFEEGAQPAHFGLRRFIGRRIRGRFHSRDHSRGFVRLRHVGGRVAERIVHDRLTRDQLSEQGVLLTYSTESLIRFSSVVPALLSGSDSRDSFRCPVRSRRSRRRCRNRRPAD